MYEFYNILNSGRNYKVAEVLLKNNAKVNVADKTGSTALHYAVFWGKMTTILRLLYQTFIKHLHVNWLTGFENRVSLLLKYDADQFKPNKAGHTPYNVAEQRVKADKNNPIRQRILEMLLKC